ncbi:MAG TPA: GNAT family N-acetyltransferase [Candidatus Aquilonibacter sp.]
MIRAAGMDDAAAITAVHCQSWLETYQGLIPQRVIEARAIVDERFSEWRERLRGSHAKRVVFVAESHGNVHGFIWIAASDASTLKRAPGFGDHIYALYVLASEHKRGVRRALVSAAAGAMLQRGSRSLSLNVLASNPGRQFYEHLGAQFLRSTMIHDSDDSWEQCAYGWTDVEILFR